MMKKMKHKKNGGWNIMNETKKLLKKKLKKGIEELKREIHNEKSGVYMIYNKKTKKTYIGSAIDLIKRRDSHLSYLRNNKHHSEHLQKSWNKYGDKEFVFYLIEYVKDKNILKKIEQFYLDNILFASEENDNFYLYGYNKARNAERPALGIKISDEQKSLSSERMKGKNNPMYGKIVSKETRNKISKNNARYWIGKTFSDEHKNNISKSHANVAGSNNAFAKLNEKQVIEIRNRYLTEKISMAKLGKEYSVSATNINDILKRHSWVHI
jgi:group I intron endonuclease